MRWLAFILVLTLGLTAPARGDDLPVNKACAGDSPKLGTDPVVPTSEADELFLRNCDPAKYYFFSNTRNLATARRCALYQFQLQMANGLSEAQGDDVADIMPMAVLTMLYVNGEGVKRDLPLAIHLACLKDPTKNDLLDLLVSAKTYPPMPKYDFCTAKVDYWKQVANFCEYVHSKNKDLMRQGAIAKLSASWTPEQRASFSKANTAFQAYVRASVDAEPEACITGTVGEEFAVHEELEQQFADDLARYVRGELPTGGNANAADFKLNWTFNKVIRFMTEYQTEHCQKPPQPTRIAERNWLAYRDAWVRFAGLMWPQVPPGNWVAELTRERTKRLETQTPLF